MEWSGVEYPWSVGGGGVVPPTAPSNSSSESISPVDIGEVTFTEGGAPVAVAHPDLTIDDPDAFPVSVLTAVIRFTTGGFDVGHDLVVVTRPGAFAVEVSPDKKSVEVKGVGTLAELQDVLTSVTYQNTAEEMTGTSRLIEVSVSGARGASARPARRG